MDGERSPEELRAIGRSFALGFFAPETEAHRHLAGAIANILLAERERCAKIADEWGDGDHSGGWVVAQNIADAIRKP